MASVSRNTQGGDGKTVTIIEELALDGTALGNQLRTACGSGGTVRGGAIEVQGDHCDLVMAALKKRRAILVDVRD